MKRVLVFLVLMLLPLTASAGEKVRGTDFYVSNVQTWETGDGSGYWIYTSEGVSQIHEGPLETGAVECHGAGFWDKDGSWGEGICVDGVGDDTRTVHWVHEKGSDIRRWEFLKGTGKYAGITGGGTYKDQELPGGRDITEWEGEVTLAE